MTLMTETYADAQRLAALVPAAPTRSTFPVHAPWTGELLGELPRCTEDDVHAAVTHARAAQHAWAARPFAERAAIVLRFHDLLLSRRDPILDLVQRETGKARMHALEELLDAAIVARHYAFHGERYLKPQRRRGAFPIITTTYQHWQPHGLVAIIAPWNYPLTLAISDAIPALLAGNAVIVEPDPQTSLTALWLTDLMYAAGMPRDVFQVLTGGGAVIGAPLIQRADFLTFTGSTPTGKIVAQQAAARLIGCALELGGKNPMIVLDDADIDAAARAAVRGCFSSTGQLCISIEHIHIAHSHYEAFKQAFVRHTQALRMGAGFSRDIDLGSLTSQRQLDTVQRHIEDARTNGAHILTGGRPRPDLGPYFYEPTILEGVTDAMQVYHEETFGPVVALYSFTSAPELIAKLNRSRFGLNASIFSRSTARAQAIAQQLQIGTVNINDMYAPAWASVDAPMGGFKESGIGRRHGEEGIRAYVEPQTIAVQRFLPIAPPPGVPPVLFEKLVVGWLRLVRSIPRLR